MANTPSSQKKFTRLNVDLDSRRKLWEIIYYYQKQNKKIPGHEILKKLIAAEHKRVVKPKQS